MTKIKQATLQELDELTALFDQYRVFYQKQSDIEGSKKFLKERIVANESVVYVSFDDQEIMTGFTQLYPLFSSTRMKRIWLLNDLFVNPNQRGRGISVALINRAKELAKQTDACGLMLETAKANTIGNSLYPKAGFVLDQDHNYYSWDI